jgi:DNA-binding beta-propeller fold protein YncE
VSNLKYLLFVAWLGVSNVMPAPAQTGSPSTAPLRLVQTIPMPNDPVGPYTDHMAVDVEGNRIFASTQAQHAVSVFDLKTGKLIHEIPVDNPHAMVYRRDINRLFIVDGGAGLVRILDASDYHQIGSVKLLLDADSMGYDPDSKMMYVVNGGAGAKLPYCFLSAVNTTTGTHVGDVKFPNEGLEPLEQMVMEKHSPRLYLNDAGNHQVAVIDRVKLTVIAKWPIQEYVGLAPVPDAEHHPYVRKNVAIALDETHHRLFVGARFAEESSMMVVFDTQTGKEVTKLPMGGWVDEMVYDPASGRIYAACGKDPGGGGAAYVFKELDPDHYELLGKVATAFMGKTATLVPSLKRYYVSVPHFQNDGAKILVFEVQ